MRHAAVVTLVALCAVSACSRRSGRGAAASDAAAAVALVEQGKNDEAIARVGERSDADSCYALGRAWIGKAQHAPLPTPMPGAAVPPEGLFKAEELKAIGFLEKATAERPDLAGAHLALAELLAPHALARLAAEREGGLGPGAVQGGGVDVSVARVLRAYADAMQADPASVKSPEALIRFAMGAGRLTEADAAFQELLRRNHEDPQVMVRYGDFLAGPRGAPEAALAQYAQALIWRADDSGTRAKMVKIHLGAAAAHLATQEYAPAGARLEAARQLGIDDPESAAKARQLEAALREVTGR